MQYFPFLVDETIAVLRLGARLILHLASFTSRHLLFSAEWKLPSRNCGNLANNAFHEVSLIALLEIIR
jgi:hypothetical protein